MARSARHLTDDEATFLALLVRVQPATAYQLSKIYTDSPVSNFGTSKGKIYPLIRRLKAEGLLNANAVAGDARRSEQLECSRRGVAALRAWMLEVRPGHLLLEDPLRTMVQSFDLLDATERSDWIRRTKQALVAKLAELEAYAFTVTVPYQTAVHDNAVSSIAMRLQWLERVEQSLPSIG